MTICQCPLYARKGGKRAVGYGIEIPKEFEGKFKFARQRSKLAGKSVALSSLSRVTIYREKIWGNSDFCRILDFKVYNRYTKRRENEYEH